MSEPLAPPERIAIVENHLAQTLRLILDHDFEKSYPRRNGMIYAALSLASMLGYPHGVQLDPAEPDWPCAFIELPEGQVAWHLPAHDVPWDGHDTQEKWRRIEEYVRAKSKVSNE